MRAITHISASAVAAGTALAAGSAEAAAGIFVLGGFLDVDHLPHFLSAGLPARPMALLRSLFMSEDQLESSYSFRRGSPGTVLFPFFHCIEMVFLLIGSGMLLGIPILAWGGAGILLHISMDIRSYPCSPMFFLMTWRLMNRRELMEAWTDHTSAVRL